MKKLSEGLKIDQALGPVDISTAKTSGWFPMANYRSALAVVTSDTVAQTKNVTVQIMQAKDASGTGSKALSAVVTKVAPTGGAKLTASVDATANLEKGFTHIAVRVTSDAGATLNAAAILIRGDGRFGNSMP